jgi:hypothetical protein
VLRSAIIAVIELGSRFVYVCELPFNWPTLTQLSAQAAFQLGTGLEYQVPYSVRLIASSRLSHE